MSLRSRVSGRLAQLRAAGQLFRAPRPWPGPSAGATRTRSSAYGPRARTPAGVGAWGAAAVGRRAGVRTWAPLAMAAKVDLNTSTDWKEAKSFLKGLSDKQREEHYFCQDFIRLKKVPTWKETAKGLTVKVEEPKYKKDKHLNEKISLFRGDITKLEVDAIVNAANSSLLGGGGVDGCIHRAAGPLLTEECRTLQNCETGKAKITCGYRLPAKYVIHTVGPIVHGEPSASQAAELRSCYLSSLDLLLEHRLRSAAFPCISTGVFGYPNEAAAEVVLAALREWLEQHKDKGAEHLPSLWPHRPFLHPLSFPSHTTNPFCEGVGSLEGRPKGQGGQGPGLGARERLLRGSSGPGAGGPAHHLCVSGEGREHLPAAAAALLPPGLTAPGTP